MEQLLGFTKVCWHKQSAELEEEAVTQEALVSYVSSLIYFLVPLIYSWLKSQWKHHFPSPLSPSDSWIFLLCSSSPTALNVSQSFNIFCFLWKLCMCYFGLSKALLRGPGNLKFIYDTDRNFRVCVFLKFIRMFKFVKTVSNWRLIPVLIIPYFSCDQALLVFALYFICSLCKNIINYIAQTHQLTTLSYSQMLP